MPTVFLETVPNHWWTGTPQEVRQAEKILARNWSILESHTIQAQKLETDSLPAEYRQELGASTLDSGQQDSAAWFSSCRNDLKVGSFISSLPEQFAYLLEPCDGLHALVVAEARRKLLADRLLYLRACVLAGVTPEIEWLEPPDRHREEAISHLLDWASGQPPDQTIAETAS